MLLREPTGRTRPLPKPLPKPGNKAKASLGPGREKKGDEMPLVQEAILLAAEQGGWAARRRQRTANAPGCVGGQQTIREGKVAAAAAQMTPSSATMPVRTESRDGTKTAQIRLAV